MFVSVYVADAPAPRPSGGPPDEVGKQNMLSIIIIIIIIIKIINNTNHDNNNDNEVGFLPGQGAPFVRWEGGAAYYYYYYYYCYY